MASTLAFVMARKATGFRLAAPRASYAEQQNRAVAGTQKLAPLTGPRARRPVYLESGSSGEADQEAALRPVRPRFQTTVGLERTIDAN